MINNIEKIIFEVLKEKIGNFKEDEIKISYFRDEDKFVFDLDEELYEKVKKLKIIKVIKNKRIIKIEVVKGVFIVAEVRASKIRTRQRER